MTESKPNRIWWRKKRWWAVALVWLIVCGPVATGPIQYGVRRGWLPRGAGREVVAVINRYLASVGMEPYASSYQRWWDLQGQFANAEPILEARRQRESWQPPPPAVMRKLRAGGFARVTLQDGTLLEGYAGYMPDDVEYVRVDGMNVDEGGNIRRYGTRLLPKEIKTVEELDAAPQVELLDGTTVTMPAGFWPASMLD